MQVELEWLIGLQVIYMFDPDEGIAYTFFDIFSSNNHNTYIKIECRVAMTVKMRVKKSENSKIDTAQASYILPLKLTFGVP